jgi:hypothetical protein
MKKEDGLVKLLESAKQQNTFRVWKDPGKPFIEYDILCGIAQGDGFDPGEFERIDNKEIDFAAWQEIEVKLLSSSVAEESIRQSL